MNIEIELPEDKYGFKPQGFLCRQFFSYKETNHYLHFVMPILVIAINLFLIKLAHKGVMWIGWDNKSVLISKI
jgi:hypothetical protein